MKSINDYMKKSKGLTLESQTILDSLKLIFDYDTYAITENGLKLNNVTVNEDIKFTGMSKKLEKGDELKSIEICKNGWLNINENNKEKYTIMNYTLNEDIFVPNFIMGLPTSFVPSERKVNPAQFATISGLQSDGIAQINHLISLIRNLTIDDAAYLKSILGPSTEEKILRTIIDCVFFDTPLESGQANGI